jgi:hypothetical protein
MTKSSNLLKTIANNVQSIGSGPLNFFHLEAAMHASGFDFVSTKADEQGINPTAELRVFLKELEKNHLFNKFNKMPEFSSDEQVVSQFMKVVKESSEQKGISAEKFLEILNGKKIFRLREELPDPTTNNPTSTKAFSATYSKGG